MDKGEAEEILAKIRRDEQPLLRDPHFWRRTEERQYTLQDVYNVLHFGTMDGGPRYDPKYRNHVIRIRGRSCDGRDTRIAISLYRVGPCWLLSIVDVKHKGKFR